MRLTTARLIFISLTTVLCGSITSSAQETGAKAHAQEILNQARLALGGEAALTAVRSLSASGDFRSGSGNAETSGEFQLDLLLPDKLMRTMKWSPTQTAKASRVEVLNGGQVWTDSQSKESQQIFNGGMGGVGGMGRGGGRSGRSGSGRNSTGGGEGRGKQPSVQEPAPDPGTDRKQIRSDFSCLILALLLHSPDLSKAEFNYASEGDINSTKADVLKLTIADSLEINLSVDQKTHLPIMVSYKIPMMETFKIRHPRDPEKDDKEEAPEPKTAEVQIYFSEYKPIAEKKIGNILLPYQITKTRDGQTVEDMHIKKLQLNPSLKSKQFEKKE